jgi:protoporphyrinogen oxidase
LLYRGRVVPFDSPRAWLTFPGFSLPDVARFGLISAYLRFTTPWRRLEKETADGWLRRWYGDRIYELVWQPLLVGKFGPYYAEANMAWMWARLHVRSPRLGYFVGGFQAFVDCLTEAVRRRGGQIWLGQAIGAIEPTADGRLTLVHDGQSEEVDQCLVTTAPYLLTRMAPALPPTYLGQLNRLKSMGAVVLILALRRQFLKETYWLNLPATSPDKSQNEIPFLALVEHTNFVSAAHYGGDHLVYCGDYVVPDHPYFVMGQEEVEELFMAALPRLNPGFSRDWVRRSWLFRARYAQPVPEVNHSANVPDLVTPIANLFYASMSQVYPWDRGTNYAVEIGRRVARRMLES